MAALVGKDPTPSRLRGMGPWRERGLRSQGAELILRAVVLLRLPQVTGCTACKVFQRFYFQRALQDFDARAIAAAALVLACKLEETHRRLRDVLAVFHRLQLREEEGYANRPTPLLSPESHEYAELKLELVNSERQILRELGFAVALLQEHPHKYVLQFVQSLRLAADWQSAELGQLAWNYLNDALRTDAVCRHRPHELAAAGIRLAARSMGLKLPAEPPWWEVFEADPQEMEEIEKALAGLYALPRQALVSSLRRAPSSLAPETPLTPLTPLPSPGEDDGGAGRLLLRRESSADAGQQERRSRSRSARRPALRRVQ